MPHYEFTTEAENDLEAIIDFTLERWGQEQAEKYLDGLEELARKLAEGPELGADRSAMLDGLISFPYASHILYYVKQPHGIIILRVLHKRMDQRRHFFTERR